jgi:hypothetical protein
MLSPCHRRRAFMSDHRKNLHQNETQGGRFQTSLRSAAVRFVCRLKMNVMCFSFNDHFVRSSGLLRPSMARSSCDRSSFPVFLRCLGFLVLARYIPFSRLYCRSADSASVIGQCFGIHGMSMPGALVLDLIEGSTNEQPFCTASFLISLAFSRLLLSSFHRLSCGRQCRHLLRIRMIF